MWPAWLHNPFPRQLINSMIKKVIEHKMRILTFSTTFVGNISHS
jgi:hypothetical protein